MIISHKYKFIFIKTRKTAGTSIQAYLSSFLGKKDIITPVLWDEATIDYCSKNYKGSFNPFPDFKHALNNYNRKLEKSKQLGDILVRIVKRERFYSHIPAWVVKSRISKDIWENYFTFCFERNPWDKTLSHYHWLNKNEEISFDDYMKKKYFCYNYQLYMDINNEKVIVDHVGKYENLSDELVQIFDHLGIPFGGSLNKRAKGNFRKDSRNYREVFLDEYKKYNDAIRKGFQKEINLHNYNGPDS